MTRIIVWVMYIIKILLVWWYTFLSYMWFFKAVTIDNILLIKNFLMDHSTPSFQSFEFLLQKVFLRLILTLNVIADLLDSTMSKPYLLRNRRYTFNISKLNHLLNTQCRCLSFSRVTLISANILLLCSVSAVNNLTRKKLNNKI